MAEPIDLVSAKDMVDTVMNMGYTEAGASFERKALRAFLPASGSPTEDILPSLSVLRRRCRLLYMSTPLATAAIDTNRTHVIGSGLRVQSTIDRNVLGISEEEARAWQQRAEAEFELWASKAENCDSLGLNTFYEMQQLAFKSTDMSGDVFALMKREPRTKMKPCTLRLHLIEADRVCTPTAFLGGILDGTEAVIPDETDENGQPIPGAGHRVFDGVEVDKDGKIVAYHICSRYPDGLFLTLDPTEWYRIPVRGEQSGLPNILHVFNSERPEQYRGVPFLARVIEPLLQLRRCTDAELMAAIVRAFFTAWIITEEGSNEIPINEVRSEGPPELKRVLTPEGPDEYRMGPGTVLRLKIGEKVEFGNPNVQTIGFDAFVKVFCRLIGASLELPYDVLVKEFDSSYSASRGALMEAWEAFKMRRSWFVADFCQPTYEMVLTEAIALGRIKAPGFFSDPLIRAAWCGAKWVGPISVSLDPVRETKAALLQMGAAIKTGAQVAMELGGGDYDDNIAKRKAEMELLKDAGLVMPDADSEPNEGGAENA